jgi:hypothetical protein
MGDVVSVIATEGQRRKSYAPVDFSRLKHLPLREAYKEDKWTRDRAKVARRKQRWKQKRWYNHMVEEFALSQSLFEDGPRNMPWECTAVLGQGSFGTVGLWRQINERGNPVDVCVPSSLFEILQGEENADQGYSLLRSRNLITGDWSRKLSCREEERCPWRLCRSMNWRGSLGAFRKCVN